MRAWLGEFDKDKCNWRNPRARSVCRMEFVAAIAKASMTGFVAGVVSADYKALDGNSRKRIGTPFSLVAQTLMVVIKDWANERHVYDLFPYFFEAGSEGYGEFSEVYGKILAHEIRGNAYRIMSCSPVGKECVPVQAADLIAYEYSHCMSSIVKSNDSGFRRPAVQELRKRLTIETRYHNSQTLSEVLSQPASEYRHFRARRGSVDEA